MNRGSRSASREPRTSSRSKDRVKDDHKNNRSPRVKSSDSRSGSRRRSPERRSRSQSPIKNNPGTVLYVGNLTRRTEESDLRAAFEKYGKIADINIIKDPYTHECRGFAFVRFENSDDATDALDTNNSEIDGRKIRVEKSKRSNGHEKTPGEYLGHYKSHGRGRRSPSPYRRRSPRGRRSRERRSRDRSDNRKYKNHGRDRYRSDSRDRYRSRSRDRSGSYSRRRR